MDLSTQFLQFGYRFTDRVSPETIECWINDARHSEWGLALETLCQNLFEFDIHISSEEFLVGMGLDKDTHSYLKRLIY